MVLYCPATDSKFGVAASSMVPAPRHVTGLAWLHGGAAVAAALGDDGLVALTRWGGVVQLSPAPTLAKVLGGGVASAGPLLALPLGGALAAARGEGAAGGGGGGGGGEGKAAAARGLAGAFPVGLCAHPRGGRLLLCISGVAMELTLPG